MKICVLDPGLRDQQGAPSDNLGDLIIQEAVNRELAGLFPQASILRCSTHVALDDAQLRAIGACDLVLVGGTNLLSSRMSLRNRSSQWAISAWDALRIRRAVLLGVGWQAYQAAPTLAARIDLRLALSGALPHSVRDGYTARQLRAAGISRVINTGCVTMWPFVDFDLRRIPARKATDVLIMVTDYDRAPDSDRALLACASRRYRRVYAWPQGTGDADYLRELGFAGTLLERSLPALDAFLAQAGDLDYLGTRLHGGIRCLLAGRRSLIVAIDNRAAEIARETGLPCVPRGDDAAIERWTEGGATPDIRMNVTAIEAWRDGVKRACSVPRQRP